MVLNGISSSSPLSEHMDRPGKDHQPDGLPPYPRTMLGRCGKGVNGTQGQGLGGVRKDSRPVPCARCLSTGRLFAAVRDFSTAPSYEVLNLRYRNFSWVWL